MKFIAKVMVYKWYKTDIVDIEVEANSARLVEIKALSEYNDATVLSVKEKKDESVFSDFFRS